MTSLSVLTTWSVVLGLGLGCGLAMISTSVPWGWRPSLVRRVEPQLRHHVPASGLLQSDTSAAGSWSSLARILAPMLQEGVRLLGRFNLGNHALQRRLEAAGSSLSVQDYRAQQLLWAVAGAMVGIVLALAAVLNLGMPVLAGFMVVLASSVLGFFLRDNLLSSTITRRRSRILAEFPTVAELFALSVSAGDSAAGALERVAQTAQGDLAEEFRRVLTDMRAGASVHSALKAGARRIQLAPVERFIDGILVALERGTPLAEVLRAQAKDVRELSKRELMESAGQKEIAMMVPLVFGILPLTVVFAVYPGISLLTFGF